VKCFVRKAPRFPDLGLDVSIERVSESRSRFQIAISATGNLGSRDAWQAAFDGWCGAQGQYPRFTRGNVRTNRTSARVTLPGSLTLLNFVDQWVGLDCLHLGPDAGASHIRELEAVIASLRRQNAELSRLLGRNLSPQGANC
jgi:hypothetical protein